MVKKWLALTILAVMMMTSTGAFAADVVITKRGKKYHTQDCGFIEGKESTKIDEKLAADRGLEPCGKCFKTKGEDKDKK